MVVGDFPAPVPFHDGHAEAGWVVLRSALLWGALERVVTRADRHGLERPTRMLANLDVPRFQRLASIEVATNSVSPNRLLL